MNNKLLISCVEEYYATEGEYPKTVYLTLDQWRTIVKEWDQDLQLDEELKKAVTLALMSYEELINLSAESHFMGLEVIVIPLFGDSEDQPKYVATKEIDYDVQPTRIH